MPKMYDWIIRSATTGSEAEQILNQLEEEAYEIYQVSSANVRDNWGFAIVARKQAALQRGATTADGTPR